MLRKGNKFLLHLSPPSGQSRMDNLATFGYNTQYEHKQNKAKHTTHHTKLKDEQYGPYKKYRGGTQVLAKKSSSCLLCDTRHRTHIVILCAIKANNTDKTWSFLQTTGGLDDLYIIRVTTASKIYDVIQKQLTSLFLSVTSSCVSSSSFNKCIPLSRVFSHWRHTNSIRQYAIAETVRTYW